MRATTEAEARVRIFTYANPHEMLAFVTLAGKPEVRVRFRRSTTRLQWRCDECGKHRLSTCKHEVAACREWQVERFGIDQGAFNEHA